MTLKPCRECGQEVSSEAKRCPHCGAPTLPPWIRVLPWLVGGVVFIVLVNYPKYQAATTAQRQSEEQRRETEAFLAPRPVSGPRILEVQRWDLRRTDSLVELKGTVKNISGRTIGDIKVRAVFYDSAGRSITSGDAPVARNHIKAQQTSPIKITVPWNPAIKTATLEFFDQFRVPVSSTDLVSAPEVRSATALTPQPTSRVRVGTAADSVLAIRGKAREVVQRGTDAQGLVVEWHYADATYVMRRRELDGITAYRVAEIRKP